MNMKYETLRARYGEPVEKSVAETETSVENALEKALPFSPEAEESSTGVVPTKTENESISEEKPPDEVVGSSETCEETELHVFLKEQRETLATLVEHMVSLDQKVTAFGASLEQMKLVSSKEDDASLLAAKFEELRQASIRQEKANVDMLRDSKNFQASVREQMQHELDRYHKMHAETANAPILTEIANLYIMSCKAISFLTDAKERKNISEIVQEGLLEILEEQGVTVNSTPAGRKRSVKACKTRKTIPTAESKLHGMVAESITPSFTLGNQVLIKECIDTYVYDASLNSTKNNSEILTEEVNTNHEESSAKPEVSLPDETKDIPAKSLTGEGMLEENGSKEERLPESATCIDEGVTKTDTLTKCSE